MQRCYSVSVLRKMTQLSVCLFVADLLLLELHGDVAVFFLKELVIYMKTDIPDISFRNNQTAACLCSKLKQ